ncbi:MAG TPA: response regulator transcription factor [Thermomicrobiales bacterium]|nr:response regulator transcription factor [Thermomicrobiales bacterium]
MRRLILVVDDEPAIVRLVRAKLVADQFQVITAVSGEACLTVLENERPDLIVLDLMMPGIDGFETLRRIRQIAPIPVIMLTARAADADKLRGLQSGADDYVTKPFNPDELAARIVAVLRRTSGAVSGQGVLIYPGLEIDLDRRQVRVNGDDVRLSKTEWELLEQLAGNVGKVMLHGELLSRIWGPEFRDESHYLRTWVSRLRAKLRTGEGAEGVITTYQGIGYRLDAPAATEQG